MRAAAQPDAPCATASAVVAPGNHDGVHLGHQALVRTARAYAQAHGLRAVALTFDPHPATVLAPDRAPIPLTSVGRRRELLLAAGADEVVVQPFTREFAGLSAEQFLQGLLDHGAAALVVGPDFRFGQGRTGDVPMLEAFGARHGLHTIVEPAVLVRGERVSSSTVREAIAAGEVERGNALLGHVYELNGEVVHGHQRGRRLGFPTANLASEPVLHPADGVYAVVVRALEREPSTPTWGIANLGPHPTFGAGRSVEVHLFDFDGDLYGAQLRVGFVKRIRSQWKFPDLRALGAQIEMDCEAARVTLGTTCEDTWAWI
jgi:riboflavin kinase/FMN adenylyltransferase